MTHDTHGPGAQCPVCGTQPTIFRHAWLYRCGSCGLLSSTLSPEIPDHPTASRIDEASRGRGLDPVRRRNNEIILCQLGLYLSPGASILDVGCGQGQFLVDAAARNYLLTGIEPDANVAPQTKKKTGIEVRQGFFPDVLDEEERFDAIIFNDVFEHIPSALAAIRACANHLTPGGVLVLNCPDSNGIFYRIGNFLDLCGVSTPFDRLWQKNLPSPHVWYFTTTHLLQLGKSVGLSEITTISLLPIVREGLADRIFHINGQSKILGVATYVATLAALPLLSVLPRDIGVVFLTKSTVGEK